MKARQKDRKGKASRDPLTLTLIRTLTLSLTLILTLILTLTLTPTLSLTLNPKEKKRNKLLEMELTEEMILGLDKSGDGS